MPDRSEWPDGERQRGAPEAERRPSPGEGVAGSELSRNGRPGGAAFFDLDKTLMAGSSGIFFARAAYETGMISRGRLAGRFAVRGARRVWGPGLHRVPPGSGPFRIG